MASTQISGQNRKQGTTQQGGGKQQGTRGVTSTGPDTDVEDDELYGLVSVLYHALQGASASRKYINDAQTADDDELKEFFERVRADDAERASEAKRLLVMRVDEEDDEDEDGGSASSKSDDEDEDT
jgi:hypothetical protein